MPQLSKAAQNFKLAVTGLPPGYWQQGDLPDKLAHLVDVCLKAEVCDRAGPSPYPKSQITFHVRTHTHSSRPVVEVFDDGRFVAAIYGRPGELKIVSKYLDDHKLDLTKPATITAVLKY